MARYPLNLPRQLKREAKQYAGEQGVFLNQFILWAVSEKVASLRQSLDDPAFPHITYRRGSQGQPIPVLRGAGVRVQTLAVARNRWHMTPAQIADEFGLSEAQVQDALAFAEAHHQEIEAGIAGEQALEAEHAPA